MAEDPRTSPSHEKASLKTLRANALRQLPSFDRRLTSGFFAVVGIVAITSLLALWAWRAVIPGFGVETERQRAVLGLVHRLERAILNEFATGTPSILSGHPDFAAGWSQARAEFKDAVQGLRSRPIRPDLRERIAAIENAETAFAVSIEGLHDLTVLGVDRDVVANAFIESVVPLRRTLFEGTEQLVSLERDFADEAQRSLEKKVAAARKTLFIASSIVATLLLFLLVTIRRTLLRLYRSETEGRLAAAEAHRATEELSTTLRESLERFHLVIEEALDAVISADSTGRITAWNRQASKLFDWPAKDVLGRLVHETLLAPEHRPAFVSGLNAFHETGTLPFLDRRFELWALRRDGEHIPIEISVAAVRRDPLYFSVFIRDLGDRNRVQAQMRASEEQFRATFEFAGVGNVQLDIPSGRFVRANATMTDILGFSTDDLQSRTFPDVTAPEDSERNSSALQRLARGEIETYAGGMCLMHKEGHRKWVQTTFTLIRDSEGQPLRILAVIQDISELRRAQSALRATEERFQMMADSAPVLMWLRDSDKLSTWFNRPWLQFTGRTMAEELGKGWLENVHPEDIETVVSAHSDAPDGHQPFSSEFRLRRHDGTWRWMFDTGVPLYSPAGEFSGYLGSCFDITDRKEEEVRREDLLFAERRAREEAEHAGRMKDEFLGTLSHELRTPLQAILGWARLIRNDRLDPEKLAQGLEVIERNTLVQKRLIEDLLDMSRIIQGKVRLDMRRVDPRSVIDAAIEVVRPAAEAKGIHIVTDYGPMSGTILADPHRIQQVFWNLLSNAIKFTPGGGVVEVGATRTAHHIEVRFRDTGQGISGEFLPHVFERFRQGDASTTRRQGGVGLGLAIVRHLVELHGGQVAATSDGEGLGATFTVALPIRGVRSSSHEHLGPFAEAGSDSPLVERESPSLLGIRILLVEDEADARELLRRVLSDRGAEVVAAASMQQALEEFVRFKPGILISDIGMPEHDGYELIRILRELERDQGSTIPAIALTAFVRDEDRARIASAGFQLHLGKPVEPARLVAAVADLVKSAA